MSGGIEVLSRTQRIIVNQNRSVSIINAGPIGSKGVQGDPGEQGVQGLSGPQGDLGSQGIQGDLGPQGIQGVEGSQGTQGLEGLSGVDGVDGAIGPIGLTGPQGITGFTGADGAIGPQGQIGLTGDTGAQGAQGLTGLTGALGPIGPNPIYNLLANRPTPASAGDKTLFVAKDDKAIYQAQSGVWVQVGGSKPGAVTVMQIDRLLYQSILHGRMWPTGVNLGPFWWEAWVCPTAGAEYWISEGYGGAHAILAGFNGGGGLTGNLWTGAITTSFTGAYVAQAGEWLKYVVTWDGSNIYVLVNGVVVGFQAFAGPRQAQYGDLFIGGSDHSNFAGRIAQVRAWEGMTPFTANPNAAGPWYGNGIPAEWHLADTWTQAQGAVGSVPAQFVTSYLNAGSTFPDLSAGFGGRTHPGKLYVGTGFSQALNDPVPTRVLDPTAPFGNQMGVARTRVFATPEAVPTGAKIFDSFGRPDSIRQFQKKTYTTSSVTLGSTEGGSLGVKTWEHAADAWGVFDGSAISFAFYDYCRVANDSANMDVRSGRIITSGLFYSSVAVRINAARSSGWHARFNSLTSVSLYRPDGTVAGTWTVAGTSTQLRVVASETTFTVYVSSGSGWTQIGQVLGETANQTEVGAGFYPYYFYGTSGRNTYLEVF